jgi:hypothetical protein
MGNDNRALGVERWREYHVTHFYESIKDDQRNVVGTVLSVALDRFIFWRIQVRVDICRSMICICHVVRKP